MKKRGREFDPHAYLGQLVAGIENTCLPSNGEPSGGRQHILDRVDAALADFRRAVLELHQVEGDSAGVETLLGELERVARRAVRFGDEFGATPASPEAA